MRDNLRTALYARVSSEQQAGDSTIASQLAAGLPGDWGLGRPGGIFAFNL